MPEAQVSRFQSLDSVVASMRSQDLIPVRVGVYVIGVADRSALESPSKLAEYLRNNAGTSNVLFFTTGRDGSYNQVAATDEVLSRASRIESEQMRIRPFLSATVPRREEAAAAQQQTHAAAPQPAPAQAESPQEEGQHARALTFEFRLDAQNLSLLSNAVNNNLDAILSPDSPPQVQRLLGFESFLDRYGIRGGGYISIRIDLEALRADGHVIDEAAVERDLRANPAAVLTHFLSLGVEGAVQIVQTEPAAGGMRPAGTQLSTAEFSDFVNLVSAARSFAETRLASGPIIPARISGHAEA
jgi:hypothetical protein